MATAASPLGGDLARLLDTERRLEERLAAARAERDRLVAEAQAAADQRERELAAELELDARRLAAALETERQQGEREIAAAAEREVKAYEATPAGRVANVARDLARRFFVGEPPP